RIALALACAAAIAGAASARAQDEPAPPLNLSADNVSGTRGPEGDIVILRGHVHITRGGTVITSENGRYLRTQGMLYLDDHVRMRDSTTTITCDHVAYSEDTDILQLMGHVVITDREAVIRAPTGSYDRRNGRADLFGGVSAVDSSQTLKCDRLVYYRNDRKLEARGRVVGDDLDSRMTLAADSVDYDRPAHEAVARGNPVLRSRDKDGKVAEVRALTLRVNNESRIAEAIDSVRVVRDTLQARADYALFDDRADRGWLLGRPRAWDDETTVTGDTLEIWTEKRALRRIVVRGDAAIDYAGIRPDTRGETSKLTGERVDVFFARDAMDSLVAVGKARNEYQAVPRRGKTAEVNRAEGDTITVYFVDRKVDKAIIQGKATGEYRFGVDVGDTTAARTEVVKYDAPRIEFIVPKDRIVLDQRSHLVYKELELHARRVEFNSENQTLVATGEPKLVDRGEEVTGHLMSYDLETRTGNIYQAETAYEKGLYHGARIRKVGDNELEVLDGSYSTCNADPPHYRFQSHRMKVYLKDKLVAKPVVFYVKNVPLLALPFYLFPIKPGRHSGFLFPQMEFGFNNQSGQFIRNAGYYWAPNDYFDLTFAGDYYQAEPSWVLRTDMAYKLLYKLDGRLYGTFARSELDQGERWDLSADHSQEISPRTRLVARAAIVSSREYRREAGFGTPLSQRLNRFLTSSLSLSHNAEWASINAVLDRRQDLDADEVLRTGALTPGRVASLPNLVESAPSLSVSFPTRTLGSVGLLRNTWLGKPLSTMYFSLNSRYLRYRERTGFLDDSLDIRQRSITRSAVATNASLSNSRRLFGWLNVSPAINANTVVFDHDELGNKLAATGTWNASLTTSTTLYGNFRPQIGPLVGLRHVVFPSASFAYSPEFQGLTYVDASGVRQQRFRSFGGIGISGFRSARMNFSLDQRLQVKLKQGDNVQRLDNLLSWNINGSYNFLWREQRQLHPLSNLGSTMRLQPPKYIGADLSWVTDVYSERPIRSMGYNVWLNLSGRGPRSSTVVQSVTDAGGGEVPLESQPIDDVDFADPWTIGLAFSSSGGYGSARRWVNTQTLNGVFHYGFSRAWRIDYSASFDVTNHDLLTQRFGLTRDLHCWQASFSRSFNPLGEAEYYFRLSIKDQKEIYLERGTRELSFGGIR
ncbi:MAG TPA: putative LPS assembly protein LptD, partial [Candidatus Eisenbacteria bacterium]|nr:putative LPS assembly protein LptD [Candidatus Eisenbacteria bacterium]